MRQLEQQYQTFARADHYIALGLAVLIFFLGFFYLDNNCNWGDDYAAYLTDGIAMAEGRYREQLQLNVILRSGTLVGQETEHVHVWAFPLLHALVYKIGGLDTHSFSDLWQYKLPSLLTFSLMAGCCFLFFRLRFSRKWSLLLVLLLCADPRFHYDIRNLCTDIMFMSLCVCSFFVYEIALLQKGKQRILCGVGLGLLLWFTYSLRLNGIVAVLCLLISHLLWLKDHPQQRNWQELLPWGVFVAFFAIFNLLLFPWPSSTSSAGDLSFSAFFNGCRYYSEQLLLWVRYLPAVFLEKPLSLGTTILYSLIDSQSVCSMISRYHSLIIGEVFDAFGCLILLLSLIGLITGFRREPHLALFTLVSFLGTAALNLGQELRYLYAILPFIMLFAVQGGKALWNIVPHREYVGNKSRRKRLCIVVYLYLLLASLLPMAEADRQNLMLNNQETLTAYSDSAIDIYRHIQIEVPEEASIAFFKPRSLYLNTGRISLLPQEEGFSIDDADYYLYYIPSEETLLEQSPSRFVPVYENSEFILYQNLDHPKEPLCP